MTILADGEVRFIGEKVAAVAADTELIAEEAVSLIDVEYEETEPILDPVETMKPGARLIHPDVVNYKGLPKPLKEPTNDFIYMTWGRGDIETGSRQADVIVENTFSPEGMYMVGRDASVRPSWRTLRTTPTIS